MSTDLGGLDDAQKCPSSNYLKCGEHYDHQIYCWQDRAGNSRVVSTKRDNRLTRDTVGSKGHYREYNGETGREVRARSGPGYHYDKGGQTHTTEGHRDDTIRKNNRKVVNGDRAEDVGGGHYANAGKGRISGSDKHVLSYATTTNRRLAAGTTQGEMGNGTNVGQSNGDEFCAGKGHVGCSSLTAYQAVAKDRTTMIGGNDNLEVQGDRHHVISKKDIIMEAKNSIKLFVGQFQLFIDSKGARIRKGDDDSNSAMVDDHHTHIKFGGATYWVNGKTWYLPPPKVAGCSP